MVVSRNPPVFQSMQARTTEELLQVWTTNDAETWSTEAFGAARTILEERGIPIPVQQPPRRHWEVRLRCLRPAPGNDPSLPAGVYELVARGAPAG